MKGKVCCLIGNNKIKIDVKLMQKIEDTIKRLIEEEGVSTFLFSGRNNFNSVCLKTLTRYRNKVRLVFLQAKFVSSELNKNLLEYYDEIVECNYELSGISEVMCCEDAIDKSDIVMLFYDQSKRLQEITYISYHYALKRNKKIVNLFEI